LCIKERLKANTESLLSRTGIGFEQKVLEANKQRGVLATEQQFFLDRYIKHLPKIHSSSTFIFSIFAPMKYAVLLMTSC